MIEDVDTKAEKTTVQIEVTKEEEEPVAIETKTPVPIETPESPPVTTPVPEQLEEPTG